MNGIEIFHYYRQDVISSRYGAGRFFRRGKMRTLTDIMADVSKVKEECCSRYEIIEKASFIADEQEGIRKEYVICIFGESGEIGFFLHALTPLYIDERAEARASPVRGWKFKRSK